MHPQIYCIPICHTQRHHFLFVFPSFQKFLERNHGKLFHPFFLASNNFGPKNIRYFLLTDFGFIVFDLVLEILNNKTFAVPVNSGAKQSEAHMSDFSRFLPCPKA
jgi:hypothetical protein